MKKTKRVVLISSILTILFIEIVLRLVVEPTSNGISFGARNKAFEKNNYILDKNNFRNNNINKDYKLLYLGDSFTFGQGLKIQDIFSNIIENTYGVKGYNIGVRGTNTLDQKIIYENHLTVQQKDFTLVYQYYYNDIDYLDKKILSPKFDNDKLMTKTAKNFLIKLANNSYFFDFLISNSLIIYLEDKYLLEDTFDNTAYNQHLKDIKKVFEISKNKDVKTLFLIIPLLNSKEAIKFSQKNYINFLKQNFIHVCNKGDLLIDISIFFNENNYDKLIANNRDYHASSYVNQLIAKEIYSGFVNENFNADRC